MTKRKAIKQAYGKFWDILKFYVDEDGWVWKERAFLDYTYDEISKHIEFEHIESEDVCRPKSLSGIENNQGWIKLEGKPNEIEYDGDVWIINKNGGIEINLNHEYLELGYATHYQPIIKPKPPIY